MKPTRSTVTWARDLLDPGAPCRRQGTDPVARGDPGPIRRGSSPQHRWGPSLLPMAGTVVLDSAFGAMGSPSRAPASHGFSHSPHRRGYVQKGADQVWWPTQIANRELSAELWAQAPQWWRPLGTGTPGPVNADDVRATASAPCAGPLPRGHAGRATVTALNVVPTGRVAVARCSGRW